MILKVLKNGSAAISIADYESLMKALLFPVACDKSINEL
jgi:hypothetical protein